MEEKLSGIRRGPGRTPVGHPEVLRAHVYGRLWMRDHGGRGRHGDRFGAVADEGVTHDLLPLP